MSDEERSARSQLREWLVAEGYKMLLEQGFGTGAENIKLREVMRAVDTVHSVDLKPGSVYGRAFDDKSELQFAILERAARSRNTAEPPKIGKQLDSVWKSLNEGARTLEDRRSALKEICVQVAAANLERLPLDRIYVTRLAVLGVTAANPDFDSEQVQRIFAALDQGYRDIVSQFQAVYEKAARRLRYRIREEDGYSWEQFTSTTVALADGFALRRILNPEYGSFERPTGPDEELELWTYLGAATEALMERMLVPY